MFVANAKIVKVSKIQDLSNIVRMKDIVHVGI